MKKTLLIVILFSSFLQAQIIDPTFNPNHSGPYTEYIGTNGRVRADGKIISSYTRGLTTWYRLSNNDGSIDTGFTIIPRNSTATDKDIAISPSGKMVFINQVSRVISIYNPDGSPITNFTSPVLTTATGDGSVIQALYQADDKILLYGNFTTVNGIPKNQFVRLNADGSVDTTFGIGTGISSSSYIYALAIQPDGKYLLGGNFSTFNGITHRCLVRLNTDGSIDSTFYPFNSAAGLAFDSYPVKIEVQSDGKIMVCGPNSLVAGIYKNRGITRLSANGNLDTTFSFLQDEGYYGSDMLVVNNNKYLVAKAGKFYRVNTNGSLDTTFSYSNAGGGLFSLYPNTLQLFPDGKILLNIDYLSTLGLKRYNMHRINADGSIDLTFNPQQSTSTFCNGIKVLRNNKTIIAGRFGAYNETPCKAVSKITENGELDSSFNTSEITIGNYGYLNIKEQDDNKILIGSNIDGSIDSNFYVDSQSKLLVRVLENGTIDTSFNYGLTSINDYEILDNGKILVSSSTTSNTIKRLNSDGSVDSSFTTITTSGAMKFTKFNDGSLFMIGVYNNLISSLSKLYKLNSDGTIDNSFSCSYTKVKSIYRQLSGSYLVAYVFGTESRIRRINNSGQEDISFTPISRVTLGFDNSHTLYKLFVNSEGKIFAYFWINDGVCTIETYSANGVLENTITSPNRFYAEQQSCDRLLINYLNNDIQDLARISIFTGTFVPTPLGNSQQSFSPGAALTSLVVSGQNILWYNSQSECGQNIQQKANETNDIPLPMTTLLVDGTTYYASQTIGGIESTYRLPVKVSSTLGISDFSDNLVFVTNPVSNLLSLKSKTAIDKIELFSLNGVKVYEKTINQQNDVEISISNLSCSIYILKVYSSSGISTRKIIKN